MYGAILGDIIGSRFEFNYGGNTKDFELFTKMSIWTDDTAMTVAVANALLQEGKDASIEQIKSNVTHSLRKWGHKYPGAGYGGRFYHWLQTKEAGPYYSYGNGSAMRVSAAGWLYDSLERTREVARATAEVTHNHPEGIKGAECTAAVIYMGRTGASKDEIKEYVVHEFGYDISESLEQLRARHENPVSCQDSLPKALVSFFEGMEFEDVVRNAVSLGGDTDTLGAIAGAMAEGMYGVPIWLIKECVKRIPEDMQKVVERFEKVRSEQQAAEEHAEEMHYLIYTLGTEEGAKHKFLAEFSNKDDAIDYVRNLFADMSHKYGVFVENRKCVPKRLIEANLDTIIAPSGEVMMSDGVIFD